MLFTSPIDQKNTYCRHAPLTPQTELSGGEMNWGFKQPIVPKKIGET